MAVKKNGKYQPSTYLAQLANQCVARLGENWYVERVVEQGSENSDFACRFTFDFITNSVIIAPYKFQIVQGFQEMTSAWSCFVHLTYPDNKLSIRVELAIEK